MDKRLTHRHIEIFKALMTAESVISAAKILCTSQPTVSRELARLEQVLGFRLFERVHGRLKASAHAYSLYEEVKRSYIGLERIWSVIEDLKYNRFGKLSLLSIPDFSQSILPGACKRFLKSNQNASISISVQESPFLEQSLTYQQYDLGLSESNICPPGTTSRELLNVDEVCAIPDGHPLLKKKVINLLDFDNQCFISLSPTDPYRIKLDEELKKMGVERKQTIETSTAVSLCNLVCKGVGIALVNPLTAYNYIGRGLNVRRINTSYPFTVNLILPMHRPYNPFSENFIQALEEEMEHLKKIIINTGMIIK